MTIKSLLLNSKIIAIPLGSLVGIIILAIVAFQFAWGRIEAIQEEIALARRDETTLRQKLDVLEGLAASGVANQVTAATTALPPRYSGLLALSQLKSLGTLQGVILEDVKVGNPNKSQEVSQAEISMDAEGSLQSVLGFIRSTANAAPVMKLEKLQLVSAAGSTRASLSITVYWSPYPAKIPPLTQGISDLSTEERQFLFELGKLSQPSFSLDAKPTSPQARPNPFSL